MTRSVSAPGVVRVTFAWYRVARIGAGPGLVEALEGWKSPHAFGGTSRPQAACGGILAAQRPGWRAVGARRVWLARIPCQPTPEHEKTWGFSHFRDVRSPRSERGGYGI